MNKSEVVRRFCKECHKATQQRKTSVFEEDFGAFGRTLIAIASMGGSELVNDCIFECQECGNKASKYD